MGAMKRRIASYLAIATFALGLTALSQSPAAGQTVVRDELVKVRTHGLPVELEVWVNKGEDATYRAGEEVKIRFRANRDCYVVLYDIDTEGFLTLLYPEYPGHDGFVEGGRIYRLPRGGARYELVAEGPPGVEYIAAVAALTPLAYRLPWYLEESYEAAGYRGYDDLEASISDVGAVRGDPYVAMSDIAYDILPGDIMEWEYDTSYTFFSVGRAHRHPRYLCYDCHGHVNWLDPYHDSCSVFEVRVDVDWHFVSHPTYYRVIPRYWYWRRYDGVGIYVGFPEFWCSLYPRHLYLNRYYVPLRRVGLRYATKGYGYLPPRYRGKPWYWGGGKGYKAPPKPHGGTSGRGGGGKHLYKRGEGAGERDYRLSKKPDRPTEVRHPERLAKLDGVKLNSGGKPARGGRDRTEGRLSSPGAGERKGSTALKRDRPEAGSKPGLRVVRTRDGGGSKAGVGSESKRAERRAKAEPKKKVKAQKRADRDKKAEASKAESGRDKGKKSSARSGSRGSRTKDESKAGKSGKSSDKKSKQSDSKRSKSGRSGRSR